MTDAARAGQLTNNVSHTLKTDVQEDGKDDKDSGVPNDVPLSLSEKFHRGSLIVHMKRDFKNPSSDFERWHSNGRVDPGLSFSLIHPQMALQKLWVKSGYLLDGEKCEPLAGSSADLWVNNEIQHGAQDILTTSEGRRAELFRLMWLRYANKKGTWMHVVLSPGFRNWAIQPEKWSAHERNVITIKNPFDEDDTITEIPSADEVRNLLAYMDATSGLVFEATDFAMLSDAVVKDYNAVLRSRFSEVLSICPLQALAGFVYSMQDIPDDYATKYRADKLAEGRQVLEAMRKSVPILDSQQLVIAEYSPTSDNDLENKVSALANSTAKRHQGNKIIQWKDEFQANFCVVEITNVVAM